MSEKKVIAVVGSTGAQGGGLVRAILADPSGGYSARAVTRNPSSEKARALAAAGAEVVAADLDDPASLRAAFRGAHGAYCVTNFWEHFSPEKELAQARAMAEAAKAEGVAHVVWSTLEDTRAFVPLDDARMPTLMERYKVPHFDAKGEANALFEATGVPTTLFHTSFYWDNLLYFGMEPKRGPDGKLAFVLPTAGEKLPGIAAADIGACAYLGDRNHYQVTIAGLGQPLMVATEQGDRSTLASFSPGEQVTVSWGDNSLVLLPRT